MTSAYSERDGRRPRPSTGGSLVYLVTNLPLGIVSFTLLVTLTTVGIATVLVWVGLPVLVLTVVVVRGAASAERARVHTLLGTYIAKPYRPLPEGGWPARWKARLAEGATWRDFAYLVLLFPFGTAEFVLVVTLWSLALALTALPVYVRYLPDGAFAFEWDGARWFVVDSPVAALPWAMLGILCLGAAIALTRVLGVLHAHFARALLGPGPFARRFAEADDSGTQPFVTAA
ncbi:sensor domain-containing protein [Amycolatopsis pigmentata]|uniref:Sensor domain-containing protein n=1 Tax=Amycolatopsis pigmentata TaxID=450801 RepID=A0ABW5FZW8_9PSEU